MLFQKQQMQNIDQPIKQDHVTVHTDQQQGTSKSLRSPKVVDICFKNISYSVPIQGQQAVERRVILNNLSGICKGGEVTAILGSSGAGKTTLLNVLACRIAKQGNSFLEGQLTANGQSYDYDEFATFASYVMQNDVLMETMTPKEAFSFVASLKYADLDLRIKRVQDTIRTMKLQRCENSMIGGISSKGISGGERKRTSIGFELVQNPSCLLLDEPTSGLDSFTAFYIINQLQSLAHNQDRTIIFTIHQPSSDIYLMFDRIMLLVLGQFIYQGPRQGIIEHFASFGFKCPSLSNPMDYFISIMHKEMPENVKSFPIYFQNYESKLKSIVDSEITNESQAQVEKKRVESSSLYQISVLASREMLSYKRNPMKLRVKIGQAIFLGLLQGGVFWAVADNNGSVKNLFSLAGALFFICINLTMAAVMQCILGFAVDRDVFLREENSKIYTTGSYFMGKQLVDLPVCIICPIIQQLISYWMMKMNDYYADQPPTHIFIAVLLALCANSMGLMAGCAFKDVKLALNIVPMVLMPLIIFSGFFANQKNFYVWIGWIQYLSPLKYAYEAMMTNETKVRHYERDPLVLYDFHIGLWECVANTCFYIPLQLKVKIIMKNYYNQKKYDSQHKLQICTIFIKKPEFPNFFIFLINFLHDIRNNHMFYVLRSFEKF
ncbi:hypothetical protein pb186bvf_006599 [Paramecium bursaria]